MNGLIKRLLHERLEQADKFYFKTGKLSPRVRETILKITGGDAFTKLITDIYYATLVQQHKEGHWAVNIGTDKEDEPFDEKSISNDMMDIRGWEKIQKLHELLKAYNQNVFPIKDFNINGVKNPLNFVYGLERRDTIIKQMNLLPSIAIRNLKNDIRTPRTSDELNEYKRKFKYFMAYYSLLGNRDEQLRKKINDKMFKSNTTLDRLIDFAEEKRNMLGGETFTKNKIKSLLNNYHHELNIIYDKGNVMAVEVSGPHGIKEIGCNSLWCFTYGSALENAYKSWNSYSTNGLVYVIIDFSEPTDSPDFMYVLIKPLKDEYDEKDEGEMPLFDMANDEDYYPLETLNRLIGLNTARKLFTFDIEPEPKPEPKKVLYKDPNQLSLFEMKEFIKNKIQENLLMENRIKFDMHIPKDILAIKDVFKKNGFKLYVVGGAVRDAILGKNPKDYDLVTDAIPDKVEQIMAQAGFKTLPTGKSFGVINVFTNDGEYEIATFRTDIGKGRNPDVKFGATIESDAQRRDLRINALYYDIDKNEIIDLVGGLNDIRDNNIQMVGNPQERFEEDPLRILRFFRFFSRFN